jgi:hypothetical protein
LQETGARNGSRTAPRLRKSEPVEGAKTNGTKLEVANEAARRRKPKQLCGPARPNSKPVWRYGCPQSQRPAAPSDCDQYDAIEGKWSSRWNGGADPTIPGDAANKWKQGEAEAKAAGDRLYLLFDWDNGVRRGLIDAHREGTRLVGKYINLTDPKVTRPWIGLIVSNQRIDGRWTGGRLDFRR